MTYFENILLPFVGGDIAKSKNVFAISCINYTSIYAQVSLDEWKVGKGGRFSTFFHLD